MASNITSFVAYYLGPKPMPCIYKVSVFSLKILSFNKVYPQDTLERRKTEQTAHWLTQQTRSEACAQGPGSSSSLSKKGKHVMPGAAQRGPRGLTGARDRMG